MEFFSCSGVRMFMRMVLLCVLVLHLVQLRCSADTSPVCQPSSTCSKCLMSPGCVWCKQQDFLIAGESDERRCDSFESLTKRKCESSNIINPRNYSRNLKENDLNSNLKNVVQLKPQSVEVKLRVGVPQEFSVEFKRAEGYPIDLYYLMDLSYSMKDDLEKIKNLGQDILNKLQEETQTVRIGFGSFVDKETLPYVSQTKSRKENPCPIPKKTKTCQPAFTFRNILPLTHDASEFKIKVSNQKISGNLDSPEAGLDAIMQAAVCQDIGWMNVTRILVYTSDDTFHMAGDGRLAGIFTPHDGQCHLKPDGLYDGTLFDYPSVGHLSQVLQANNIQLIFAVTENSFTEYKALSALIPQSVVGVLKNDSSNVVQLISEAYGNLSATLLLEHITVPGLDVTYKSHCKGQSSNSWQNRGECSGIRDEKVSFTVRLNASQCLTAARTFEIQMKGINEVLKVSVETLCDCECGDKEENSDHCTGNGTLECGTCRCNKGYVGQQCKCTSMSDSTLRALCRQGNNSQECSGNGVCECGQCVCSNSRFSGNFCQCDDSSCARNNNTLCSNHGTCSCGECKCDKNYSGSACECLNVTDMCSQGSGKLCSGRGTCACNQCKCDDGFTGPHCSQINNPCSQYLSCLECTVRKNCNNECPPANMSLVTFSHMLKCVHLNFTYDVSLDKDGHLLISYAYLPGSVDKTKVIIGSAVSGIILIGLLIIIIYKILLVLYDRREYHNFIKAQEHTKWEEGQNPLFKEATTTVLNPLHVQDS